MSPAKGGVLNAAAMGRSLETWPYVLYDAPLFPISAVLFIKQIHKNR